MMQEVPSINPESAAATEPSAKARSDRPSCTLGPDDVLQGKLYYEGRMRVEGHVEGELRVSGDIEIARGAKVNASLEASNVTVQGEVQGPVTARNRLNLGGSGQISGDVQVGKLQVSDGATLNGNVRMGSA